MNAKNEKKKAGRPAIQFPSDNATNEWLAAQKPSTRSIYRGHWRRFLDYCSMSGDQILADRKNDKEGKWERKVVAFKAWLVEQGASEYFARQGTVVARSFFHFHRTMLAVTRQESGRLRQAQRKTEDYRFSREELKKMSDVGDLTEKYVVTVGKSMGLRAGDFLRLTRGDLEPYINRETPISIGEYATQKEGVKAYPFIDSDAKPIVQLMLEQLTRDGRIHAEDRMLTYQDEIQLSRTLKRVANKAGINYGSKVVRFHCLRKFLTDRLSNYMSESKWKQIVGKQIAESAYVSAESLRDDYARAMSETTFTKSVAEEDIKLLARKEALMMLAKIQGTSEEEMKKIFRSRKAETTIEQVKILEEKTEQKTQRNGGCSNGQHCQRVVDEEQLEPLLAEGWRVITALPSGKIVLER